MSQEEKLEALRDWYLELYQSFSEHSVQELSRILKTLLLHISDRSNTSVEQILYSLAHTYQTQIVDNADKSDDEVRQMTLDEIARQEEHTE